MTSADPLSEKISSLEAERKAVREYPDHVLSDIIRDLGFECTLCGKCCTRQFNGHVFLLDEDIAAIREADPSALIPAPGFDLCDQDGNFYVSGYAIRTRADGTCFFLENGRCRIYREHPAICRVYPYMLHREPDQSGKVDWRQISGLNQHGYYHTSLDSDECRQIAAATKAYEMAFLDQQVRFYRYMGDFLSTRGLRHIRRIYDLRYSRFLRGSPACVYVLFSGSLERWQVTRDDYWV